MLRKDTAQWDRKRILRNSWTHFPAKITATASIVVLAMLGALVGSVLEHVRKNMGRRLFRWTLNRVCLRLLKACLVVEEEGTFEFVDKPLVISNHVCWVDIFYLITRRGPVSFLAKENVASYPLIGQIARFSQSIFVSRERKSDRGRVFTQLSHRIQSWLKENKSSSDPDRRLNVFPLSVYPEGTISDGRSVLEFQSGAFGDLAPMKVLCLHYEYAEGFEPGMHSITELEHAVMYCCMSGRLKVTAFDEEAKPDEEPQ